MYTYITEEKDPLLYTSEHILVRGVLFYLVPTIIVPQCDNGSLS